MAFRRLPPPPEYFDRIAENARKKREAQAAAVNLSPRAFAQTIELPVTAASFILGLVERIKTLEQKVSALEGPPHLSAVEKRG